MITVQKYAISWLELTQKKIMRLFSSTKTILLASPFIIKSILILSFNLYFSEKRINNNDRQPLDYMSVFYLSFLHILSHESDIIFILYKDV